MWHEGQGGRGSCEIASAMEKFLTSLPNSVKRVILYSDTCAGQNRNQKFSAMCLSAVQNCSIGTIDHVYMESGHSQMECDSAHSAIESALRYKDVYCPNDIYQNIALARKQNSFEVEHFLISDILNYKLLSKKHLRNKLWDSTGQKVQWLKMKWIRYGKREPSVMLFKYDYDEKFRRLQVKQATRGRASTAETTAHSSQSLQCLYDNSPEISKSNFNDLHLLCKSNAIPQPYHAFYDRLRYDEGESVDRLPEPDREEIQEPTFDAE